MSTVLYERGPELDELADGGDISLEPVTSGQLRLRWPKAALAAGLVLTIGCAVVAGRFGTAGSASADHVRPSPQPGPSPGAVAPPAWIDGCPRAHVCWSEVGAPSYVLDRLSEQLPDARGIRYLRVHDEADAQPVTVALSFDTDRGLQFTFTVHQARQSSLKPAGWTCLPDRSAQYPFYAEHVVTYPTGRTGQITVQAVRPISVLTTRRQADRILDVVASSFGDNDG